MKETCPLGHTFVTYRDVNHRDKRDLNKLAEMRTLTRLDQWATGDYTHELYLVCPVCGVVFKPSPTKSASEKERAGA